jgi:hypothetical protein
VILRGGDLRRGVELYEKPPDDLEVFVSYAKAARSLKARLGWEAVAERGGGCSGSALMPGELANRELLGRPLPRAARRYTPVRPRRPSRTISTADLSTGRAAGQEHRSLAHYTGKPHVQQDPQLPVYLANRLGRESTSPFAAAPIAVASRMRLDRRPVRVWCAQSGQALAE